MMAELYLNYIRYVAEITFTNRNNAFQNTITAELLKQVMAELYKMCGRDYIQTSCG